MISWIFLLATAFATDIDLAHQARLVDSTGNAISGDITLTIGLYGQVTGGSPIHTWSFPNTPVSNGYVSLTLPIDHALLANTPLYLEYTANSTPLLPRSPLATVPRAATAELAAHIPTGDQPSGACTDLGAISFDPSVGRLSVCGNGRWWALDATAEVTLNGDAREWADGTYARTCDEYKNPSVGYRYGGDTGDGYYRIDPDQNGAPTEAWCDMTRDGGGWTLCFAYTTAEYDAANWPSIAESRDKLLSKTWGETRLHDTGTSQGSFCAQMPIAPGTTQLAGEVVQVANNTSQWRDTFTVAQSGFFTQVHTGGTSSTADCLISDNGSSRLMYANYTTPGSTYNGPMLLACSGSAGSHTNVVVGTGNGNGIDTSLLFSRLASGGSSTPDELALQVNWYSEYSSLTLHTNTINPTETKFGISVPYVSDGFGRSGPTPGPGYCYSNCGYTNVQQATLEQWLWVR